MPVSRRNRILNYSPTRGLVHYFPMDELIGNRADLVNGTSLVPTGVLSKQGRIGAAAYFGSSLGTVSMLTPANPYTPGGHISWTVAFQLYIESVIGTAPNVVSKSTSGINEWYIIYVSASGVLRFRVFDMIGGVLASADQAVSISTWYDIRLWLDAPGNRIGVQRDGGAKVITNMSNNTFVASRPIARFAVGGSGGGVAEFDARVDNVAVYNRLITDEEWSDLRTAWGAGGVFPTFATPAPTLALYSPQSYQVFQRSGSTGTIIIQGNVWGITDDVEASFNGGAYATIGTAVNGAFTGTLTSQAQGQGTLTVRLKNNTSISATVALVGIGDVFIIAGQSNASGRGTNNQVYSHATLKGALFGNDYLWKELFDPTDDPTNRIDQVSTDSGTTGSVWPLLATSVMADQSVPVAFVPCASGGTSITAHLPTADHQDRNTLYGSMAYRAALTGCKAVLWWQGETDATAAMSQATYNGHLDTLANAINTDLGVKLMPCLLQNSSGVTDVDEQKIRDATSEAWGDNANVLVGPSFSDIASDDTFHLMTDAKLLTAAGRWWTALETVFY